MASQNGKVIEILDAIFAKMSEQYPQTSFEVVFWDGTAKKYGQSDVAFKITIRSEQAIKNILSAGTLGFGQEFTTGNIVVEGDLQKLLMVAGYWSEMVFKLSLKNKFRIFLTSIAARANMHNAAKNAERHYDIGNDFYSLWLDSTMTYSCAYFKNENDDLETAQNNKYDHICKKLQLKQGESLVDIGCGWGGMMFFAAKNYGAKCVGYTLAKNQHSHILNRVKKEGLEDKITVFLKDYRKAEGVFDKFVSIGMFEHVGRQYYPDFFQAMKRILRPKGIGVLHNIGSGGKGGTDPWIDKYIFPGGYIPSLAVEAEEMNNAGLVFYDIEDLRPHYAKTLDLWANNFEAQTAQVKKIIAVNKKDEQKAENFIRMWRLYLNASSVSFKTGSNHLYQITFSNGINHNLPLTRDYIYSKSNC